MGGSTIVAKRERNLKFIPRVSSCSVGHTSVCLRLRYLHSDPAWPPKEPRPDGPQRARPGFRAHHRWILNRRSRAAVAETPMGTREPVHRWILNHSSTPAVEDPPMTRVCPQVRPRRTSLSVEASRRPSRDPAAAAPPGVELHRGSAVAESSRPRSRRSSHGVDRGSRGQTPPPRSSPPSAVMVWPVSQAASSESRKPTTPAMSSGSPRRLSGYGAETSSSRPS